MYNVYIRIYTYTYVYMYYILLHVITTCNNVLHVFREMLCVVTSKTCNYMFTCYYIKYMKYINTMYYIH